MLKQIICRHVEVTWIDTHSCRCMDCGRFGHFFEEGYSLWGHAERRIQMPSEPDDVALDVKKAG